MKQETRERVALIVLPIVLVVGLVVMAAVIITAHSLNFAASKLDERVGQMEDYRVVLFAGTAQAEEAQVEGTEGEGTSKGDAATSGDAGATALDGAPASGEAAGVASDNAAADSDNVTATASGDTVEAPSGDAATSDASDAAALEGTPGADSSLLYPNRFETDVEEPAPYNPAVDEENARSALSAAQYAYLVKGAEVLIVDTLNPLQYAGGKIVTDGTYRLGVLYLDGTVTPQMAQLYVDDLRFRGAQSVIVLANDTQAAVLLDNVGVTVWLNDDNVTVPTGYKLGSLELENPVAGEIGVVVISPANFITVKSILTPATEA